MLYVCVTVLFIDHRPGLSPDLGEKKVSTKVILSVPT
jgi:hypothetical protein